jgi:hypothetical protein
LRHLVPTLVTLLTTLAPALAHAAPAAAPEVSARTKTEPLYDDEPVHLDFALVAGTSGVGTEAALRLGFVEVALDLFPRPPFDFGFGLSASILFTPWAQASPYVFGREFFATDGTSGQVVGAGIDLNTSRHSFVALEGGYVFSDDRSFDLQASLGYRF